MRIHKDLLPAARIIEAGVPVFIAPRSFGDSRSEFNFPRGWQSTEPSLDALKGWTPGMAVCAVTGVKFDVLDVDPRNGGEHSYKLLEKAGVLPEAFGEVATPSGGRHYYIPRTHLRKNQNVWPGIDVQAGDDFEYGRGFVFIPPTIRKSKENGARRIYAMVSPTIDVAGCLAGEASAQQRKWMVAYRAFYKDPLAGIPLDPPLGREIQPGDPWQGELLKRFGAICQNLTEFPRNTERKRETSEWSMLNRQAVAAGGLVSGSGLPEGIARQGLLIAVSHWVDWGWALSELEYFIDRGIRYGKTLPIRVFEDGDDLLEFAPEAIVGIGDDS